MPKVFKVEFQDFEFGDDWHVIKYEEHSDVRAARSDAEQGVGDDGRSQAATAVVDDKSARHQQRVRRT